MDPGKCIACGILAAGLQDRASHREQVTGMTIDERCKRRMAFGDPRPVEQHLTSLPERREVDLDEMVAKTTKPFAGRLVDAGAFRHAVPFAVA